jgi:hypothetical protein
MLTRIEDARVTHRLCRTVTVICIAGLAGLPIAPLAAQQRPTIRATRAEVAPTLDGRDDDTVWRSIPATSGFREARPTENGDPAERTTFKVAFDDAHLYVFVRAFDSSPDSIVGLLSRRDVSTASDMIMVMLDSYHDRRTGYEFVVNPRNVKFDAALYDDGEEDDAWDGVWDSATRVDSLGWTAEFRIPLSQVRFAPSDSLTFGFAIWRRLARHTADLTWPLYQQSQTGLVSQFADLTGLEGIASPKRAELIPYILTRNEPDYLGSIARRQRVTLGGDLKYAVTPNVTLTATVNPDFGQIEADPGELNLSAFETFFEERRPFFVAGAGLFNFRVNCFAVVDCSTGEALFYSRRIGRAPSLTAQHGDLHTATATPILGAVKLTGRMPGGLSFGLLDAVTNRVGGAHDLTVEPRTNFGVVRANQDFDQGNTSIGAMVTATHRDLDPASEPYLHQAAYSGGDRRPTPIWPVRAVGVADGQPRQRQRGRHRPDPAAARALFPAPRRRRGLRPHPHHTRRVRRGTPDRQGRGNPHPVRVGVRPSLQRLRDQRHRVPESGQRADLEQLVRAILESPQPDLPARAMEFQLLAVLVARWPDHRPRLQHQQSHSVYQSLVAAPRRHGRPGPGLLRPRLYPGWPGAPGRTRAVAAGRRRGRRPPPGGAFLLGTLQPGGRWPQRSDHPEPRGHREVGQSVCDLGVA